MGHWPQPELLQFSGVFSFFVSALFCSFFVVLPAFSFPQVNPWWKNKLRLNSFISRARLQRKLWQRRFKREKQGGNRVGIRGHKVCAILRNSGISWEMAVICPFPTDILLFNNHKY